MKKVGIVSLMIVAMVAFCVSDASAYRYYGGTYMYGSSHPAPSGDLGGWGDIGSRGPYNYDGTTAQSDAASDAGITDDPNDGLGGTVHYTEPTNGDNNAVGVNLGKTAWWWGGSGSNDRSTWLTMDLGQQVVINAIASIHNFTRSGAIGMDWSKVWGSNDQVTWVLLTDDGTNPGPPSDMKGQLFHRPRRAATPVGLFLDGSGNYTLETVTYQYLDFKLSPSDGNGFAISEILIDAVPEPATMLMLLGGGLFGLLRRRS